MARPAILEIVTPKGVLAELQAEMANAQQDVIRRGAPALRAAMRKGELDAEKRLKAYWNNIPEFIEKHTYAYKFSRKALTGRVAASGRKIELRRFMTRIEMRKAYFAGQRWKAGFPRTRGVTVKAYRKKPAKVYLGTFVAEMKSGFLNIFKRTGDKRLPIKVQYAAEDMNWPLLRQINDFENKAAKTFADELNKALDNG